MPKNGGMNMSRAGIDKQVILQAAVAIADNEGIRKITLKSISEKLGIRTPSLYNHVDSLDSLLVDLMIYAMEQLGKTLSEAAIGVSGDNAIKAISKAYLEFARKNPGLYETIQWVNLWRDDIIVQPASKINDLIDRVLECYNLNDEYKTHIIRMFRSLLHGFSSLDRNSGFGNPIPIDDSFNVAINCLIESLHLFCSYK